MTLRSLISCMAASTALLVSAQSECTDYWKGAPRANDARFTINGQSRGASVQVDKPTELNIIIYKGQDYRISFAYDEKILGDHLLVRLVEKVREPKGGSAGIDVNGSKSITDERKVIWDNQEHDNSENIEFSATSTKRIAIEVTAPGVPQDEGKGSRPIKDIGCLGILIEHMPTPVVGF